MSTNVKLIDDIRAAKADADRAQAELGAAQARLEEHRQTLQRHLQEASELAGHPIQTLAMFDEYVIGLEEELREQTMTFAAKIAELRAVLTNSPIS
jgi:uncharacterized membrane-anchored protein YhcB (DUF1043 family)